MTPRKPTTPKVVSPGARKVIGDALAAGVTPERVTALVDQAFAAEVTATAVCEDCGGAMKVKIPDMKKQVEIVVAMLEQAEGRPGGAPPGTTTVIIERPAL